MARSISNNQRIWRDSTLHCRYCGHKLYSEGKFKATIEHFYPFKLGQLDKHWNRLIVCHRCNADKNGHMPEKYVQILYKRLGGSMPLSFEYRQDILDIIKNIQALIVEIRPYFEVKDLL